MTYDIFENLCAAKNVRPADVTRATGITSATFSEWKKGTYTPKQDKLQKIADYFGVSLEYLMTGKDKDLPYDAAAIALWSLAKDSALMEALKTYNKMSPEKKQRIVDLIHLLGDE